jgi:RNA polymerase sigma-70 factor (ECF subfamily)
MSRLPEPELLPAVAAARAGDAGAWDLLMRRYQRPLFVFVNELVRREADSLDLVQETFLRAVKNLPGLREDARFGSWLFGIAHQLCHRRARRAWREDGLADTRLADEIDETVFAPGEQLLRDEEAAEVFALLAALPEPMRAVLTLHVLEDFSLEEIAEVTGVPVGTVKSRLHHAKRALRERLGGERSKLSRTRT